MADAKENLNISLWQKNKKMPKRYKGVECRKWGAIGFLGVSMIGIDEKVWEV